MEIGCESGKRSIPKSSSHSGGIPSKSSGKTSGNSFTIGTDSRERCRSPIGWFEVGEAALIGPDSVHEEMEKVQLIRDGLKTTQSGQKSYVDGVMIFGKKGKLDPRYVGLYRILKRVGNVAYELELLAAVYPVFHISLLKKCVGDPALILPLESVAVKDSLTYEEVPVEILDRQHNFMFLELTSVRYQFLVLSGGANVTPQKSELKFSEEKGKPRRGSRAVIKTMIYHPHCGSHPPRTGGPRSPSWVVDHHISHGKDGGRKAEPPKAQASDHGALHGLWS
ncbi:hypothetical protein MTR67_023703 [Solanum verrucosum]|uniref:Tf2-1-like SH3-like domain-containing protein n=1 Tax=Solanum verrucosum TaxID=315347 RepID=A0AAF0QXP0_SOLVR|nr:hypothetical protein MTR67_023703 [Solanum verrucosum]